MEGGALGGGWPHLLTSMNPPVMVPFLLYWSPLMVTQLRWRASRVTLPAVSMSLHTMILPKICTPLLELKRRPCRTASALYLDILLVSLYSAGQFKTRGYRPAHLYHSLPGPADCQCSSKAACAADNTSESSSAGQATACVLCVGDGDLACATAFVCCSAQLILLTRGRASSPKSGYCTGCGLMRFRGMKVTRPARCSVSRR